MSTKLFLISNFIQHFLKAGNEHSIHSPFLFELYCNTVKNKHSYYAFEEIEQVRKQLLNNKSTINIKDFGAGSNVNSKKKRRISDIAKNSLTPANQCQFLFKLVNELKPKTIIELGTSLGITSSYLAKVNSKSIIHTIEACTETHTIAKSTFEKLNLKNVKSHIGTFTNELPKVLTQTESVDLAFIDGHHAYKPTLEYYEMILPKLNEHSIVIFDDIYWSEGMKKAWTEIINKPEIMISVDLFYFGIVFFRKNQPKQHFSLKL